MFIFILPHSSLIWFRDLPPWLLSVFGHDVQELATLWHQGVEPEMVGPLAGMYASFCPKLGCVHFECVSDRELIQSLSCLTTWFTEFVAAYLTGWVAGHAQHSALDNEVLKAMYADSQPCSEDCFLAEVSNRVVCQLISKYWPFLTPEYSSLCGQI